MKAEVTGVVVGEKGVELTVLVRYPNFYRCEGKAETQIAKQEYKQIMKLRLGKIEFGYFDQYD